MPTLPIPGLTEGYTLPLKNLQGAGLLTFGNIFFVHSSSGSDSDSGTQPVSAKATIAAALALCTANNGDVVFVLPGHAETVTSAITMGTAGVSLVGLGNGTNRPSVTGNGTIDAINVTAANCLIQNIQFPAPGTTSQTSDINIAAAGVTVRNTLHIGSATSKIKVDMITITAAGDDFLLDEVRMYNTVETTNTAGVSIEGACARGEIRNCYIVGEFATAPLMDEATATLLYIHHNTFKNVTAAKGVVTFTTGNSTGVMSNNFCSGRHTTIASNVVPGTGMDFHENYVVEQPALNGLYIPAQDAD